MDEKKDNGDEYIEFIPYIPVDLKKTRKRGYCFVYPFRNKS
jgi:hypothetical protein